MSAPRRIWPVLILLAAAPWAAAADADQPLRRIAFGSCAHQDKPQPIWRAIVDSQPELFLFIGDTVYADTQDMAVMKAKYQKLADHPGWQALKKTCPVLGTWDDHDLGGNDVGGDYPKKKESQQIFLDFFGEPADSPRRQQDGVYQAKLFGPPGKRVQVILLDTRYHRSPLKKRDKVAPDEGPYVPTDDPKATFLGETQWRWLEEQLKEPAQLRILASSIQVIAEDHGWEKWMNIPHERERLFKLLKETKASGVIIISGDRHLAELSEMDAGVGYPLYDLTSSGLNQASSRWRPVEVNRHRVGTMPFGNNFGLITVDWDRADPRVSLQVRDEDGDVTLQQKFPLSVLQPGRLADKVSAAPKLADTGTPLTAEEVKKRLNQKVTLEFTVQATGASAALVFLNSATDRRAEDNFTVVLEKAAVEGFKSAGVASPAEHFKGKTVRVTGTLTLFKDAPQVKVDDPKQIEIVEK